ncbi:MAG TPA: lasso peptide biosynthesis B2 protein [Sphingomicrobium sp.]|nr:lasso peptide biosynthesis B2 protein [Sphingomicrobium sp.]
MGFQLRDGIHWCDCEGRAIFLDVDNDRYFCLPSAINEAFKRLAHEQPRPGDAVALKMLCSRGVLVERNGLSRLRSPARIDPPTHDLAVVPGRGPGLDLVVRALISRAVASRRLRTRSFADVLARVHDLAGKSRSSAGGEQEAARCIARAEEAITLLTAVPGKCLVRALSVHSLCARYGVSTKLVFGVIAHPFSAHCWVQSGGAVLVGDYEQARLYTPILALG